MAILTLVCLSKYTPYKHTYTAIFRIYQSLSLSFQFIRGIRGSKRK